MQIRPAFLKHFDIPSLGHQQAVANNKTGLTTPLVAVYACGVLASCPQFGRSLPHFLWDTLITLALYYADTDSVASAVRELRWATAIFLCLCCTAQLLWVCPLQLSAAAARPPGVAV